MRLGKFLINAEYASARQRPVGKRHILPHKRLLSEVARTNDIEDNTKNKLNFIEYKSGPSFADKIILQADKYGASLAQCVSSDFAMDKGLARHFKTSFGNITMLKEQDVKPGGAAILPYKNCFIYYLVTRERWWDRGCYKYLRSSLAEVRDHCELHNVADLRMGRLGSGPDGLDWFEVREIIKDTFKNTDITIIAQITRLLNQIMNDMIAKKEFLSDLAHLETKAVVWYTKTNATERLRKMA